MKRLAVGLVQRMVAVARRLVRYLDALGIATRTSIHPGGRVPGLLSIVIPAHNVERYIHASLGSVRRQPYRNVEVIVVDDESTDATAVAARRHRRRDPRVRLIRRENGGPSAARNTGVRAARGEFLTFLDPDDILRPEAYVRAITTLRDTGSDFAVLSYDRMEHGRRRRPGSWITEAHSTPRLRSTLESAPDIQVNAVVWSKVFRRAFYDAAGIRFPEGMIYEDQPVSARAYARARSFDILDVIGVSWRIRDEGTSITQQTQEAANLRAHNEAVRASLAELEAGGHPAAADARALQLLANNMRLFIRHVDVADDEYWGALRAGLDDLMPRVSQADYLRSVPAQEKVLNELILRGDRTRARVYVEAGGMDLSRFPIEHRTDGSSVAMLPFFGDSSADIPADRFVLADRQRVRP